MSRFSVLLISLATMLMAAACSNPLNYINAYKIDIQQGNVVTQDAVAQLKPGQTREQVRYILGTPVLADVFHQQRWDYVYSYRDGRTGSTMTRHFSVYFDQDNRLVKVTGDVAPAVADELGAPAAKTQLVDLGSLPADGSGKPMPPPEGPGFFEGLLDSLGF